jgi:subtilisin family serine protease
MRSTRLRLGVAVAASVALAVGGASSAASADPSAVEGGGAVDAPQEVSGPVMVELAGEPAAVVYAEARGRGASKAQAGEAAKARKAANEQAQQGILAAIERQGIDATPIFDVQTSYNGIAVQADAGAATELAALPGVKAVHAIPLVELDNHYSVPFIGAPEGWEAFGKTGTGMSIAVIDTGLDYVHTGFGGSGSSADLMIARSAAANPPAANDNPAGFTITGSTGQQIYPSAKVVGGFDLVGDTYNADSTSPAFQPVPNPDPNPMDCNGHGTHVSGTAAGTGVNADGSTYIGPYDTSIDTAAMGIGPGVAPEAGVYAVRVFGCAGSTAVTAAAIEWASDPNRDGDPSDHVDVINMSLGSAYGTPDDPSAAASNNAAALGVIVVTSAGNNTDNYYVTSSPGTAVRAVSTASSRDASERADAIIVTAPASAAATHIGSRSVNFNWGATPERSGNVYYPATNQYGCSAWTGADLANIAGRIVLVDWKKPGDETFPCGSAVRANNATAANAAGIIMADNVPFLDTAIAGNAFTPGMYTTSTVGDALKAHLTAGAISSVQATLSTRVRGNSVFEGLNDTLSTFSSRGPRGRDNGLKPDISAPGQTIWSPNSWALTEGRSLNGTSMASPHMAGTMALLKQANPTWTGEELKALAMNTAGHDIYTGFGQTGDKIGVGRVGAGRVDVPAALSSSSIALNADGSGSVSVSFGAVEVAGTLTATRTIRVVNRGSSAQTYSIGYDARTSIPGVSYSFPDGTSVAVPAGGSATFRVQLNADASLMQNTRDASVAGVQGGNPRQWVSEASGLVTVTPSSGPALRVPVYAAARPASTTKAAPSFLNVTPGGGGSGTINIAGEGVDTGAEPLGYLSKVSTFELQHTSGLATLGSGVSALARNGDLQHVGVATKTLPAPTGTVLHFGVSTHGDWSPAATDNQITIQIDRNADGVANWHAFNTRFTDTDVFVVAGQQLTPPTGLAALTFTNIFNSNVNTAPYNNNVMILPIPVAAIGLPAGQTSFRYRVIGSSRFWGMIETTPWLTYDYANPGLTFPDGLGGRPMYPALEGQKITVGYNAANFAANGSQGMLLLHHFNQKGKRAEVLEVRTRGR